LLNAASVCPPAARSSSLTFALLPSWQVATCVSPPQAYIVIPYTCLKLIDMKQPNNAVAQLVVDETSETATILIVDNLLESH
jgi:hypothetical protein